MRSNSIGQKVVQKDGRGRVTGEAKYYADFMFPGMLHTKILRSPYPAADIISIDTSEAEKLDGVKLVMTHINYPQAFRKSLYYVGDIVAAVIAKDIDLAEEALELIKVEYEKKPFVLNAEEASLEGAPQVFDDEPNYKVWKHHAVLSDRDPNTRLFKTKTPSDHNGFGDVDKGFAEADYIVDQKNLKFAYCKAPAMENRGCVVNYDGNKLQVHTHSQGLHDEKFSLAKALGISFDKINYVSPYTGGGFGGKNPHVLDRNVSAHYLLIASFACLHLKTAVSCVYSREEEMVCSWSRGSNVDVKIGFKKDGTLTTMDYIHRQEVGSGGDIWPSKNGMLSTGAVLYSRNCEHNRARIANINTNRFTALGWQGYGVPESNFGVETTMDIAAHEMGIDPVEIRKKNCMRALDVDTGWDPLAYISGYISGSGIEECLDHGAERVEWAKNWKAPGEKTSRIRSGLGVAIFALGAGRPGKGNSSEAIVKIHHDGSASLLCAIADMGQGQHTVQCQIVAEVLGIPYDRVGLVAHDTDSTPFATLAAGSCGTWIQGWATYGAAQEAKNKLLEIASKNFNLPADQLETGTDGVYEIANPKNLKSYQDAFGPIGHYGGPHEVIGHYVNNNPHERCFKDGNPDQILIPKEKGAQFISLDVDTETGMISNVRMTMVQNVGRALNPKIVAGQLLTTRHGFDNALLANECIVDKRNGWLMTPNLIDYRFSTAMECDVDPNILEIFDPSHPFGASACGEGAACPTLACFSNAIFNATGVRLTETPFTPEKILEGLGKIVSKRKK